MDPDQTAPKGAVGSGSILFATMIIEDWSAFLILSSRHNKQMTFLGMIDTIRVKLKGTHCNTRPQGYKTFFMLNSTEHEISTAHKN